jgi:hypothetical protein
MRIDSSGNVGIGTSSPAKQLDLAANNTGITTGDPLNTLRFTDTDTTSAAGQPIGRVEWYSADTDTAGVKAYIQAQSTDGSPDADMIFATNHVSGGGTAERMRIQYDGNVGIGTSSPTNKLTVDGNTNITGNTTLGDASTDTVTVNGYMGVGGAGSTTAGLYVRNTALTGTGQYGFLSDITATSAATSTAAGLWSRIQTQATAFTLGNGYGIFVQNAVKGAGSTITNQSGVVVADQTQGTNNYGILSLVSSGTDKWNIYASGTAANYFAGNVLINRTAGVGSERLSVNGSLAIIGDVSGNGSIGSGSAAGRFIYAGGATGGVSDSGAVITRGSSAAVNAFGVELWTNNTERMRLDSAGNLGLGVTPSAWSLGKAFEVGFLGTSVFAPSQTITNLTNNTYYSSGAYRYATTNAAAYYSVNTGVHQWYTAPSGTAGNAITFTQAMTLDASGRLLIGTTTVRSGLGYLLAVEGGSLAGSVFVRNTADNSGPASVLGKSRGTTAGSVTAVVSGDVLGTLLFQGADGTGMIAAALVRAEVDGTPGTNDMPGRLIFATTADGGSSSTERMRIDSSGNVGIGTSSPTVYGSYRTLEVRGTGGGLVQFGTGATTAAYLFQDGTNSGFTNIANGVMTFGTNNTERARITSGGYFKASNSGSYTGITASYHELRTNVTNEDIFRFANDSASPYGGEILFPTATPNNTTNFFLYCADSTNVKAIIYSSGTFQSRTNLYQGISDIKLKQDIVDANSQWDDIKALRFVKYRLKDEVLADSNYPAHLGLIAQEVEQTSPGLVNDCPDFENVEVTDDDGNITTERRETGTVTKAVKYSILYMKAVKALQEAMTRIEQLEAKVAALEGKK